METPGKKKKPANPVAIVAGAADGAEAGPILVANIAVGLGLGYLLQYWWGGDETSKPWPLLCGLLLGIVSGFYQVFKREAVLTRRWKKRHAANKKESEKKREPPL